MAQLNIVYRTLPHLSHEVTHYAATPSASLLVTLERLCITLDPISTRLPEMAMFSMNCLT